MRNAHARAREGLEVVTGRDVTLVSLWRRHVCCDADVIIQQKKSTCPTTTTPSGDIKTRARATRDQLIARVITTLIKRPRSARVGRGVGAGERMRRGACVYSRGSAQTLTSKTHTSVEDPRCSSTAVSLPASALNSTRTNHTLACWCARPPRPISEQHSSSL